MGRGFPSVFTCSTDKLPFTDRDEERAKYPDADGEPLYLSYDLLDKDSLDTSFLKEIKSIVDSSEIHSRKEGY